MPDKARHLEIYHEDDIHFDSFLCTGGTTTCDALWMGVPVVTLPGDRPSAQLAATILRRMSLSELIAFTRNEYAQIVTELAHDYARLTSLRQSLKVYRVAPT